MRVQPTDDIIKTAKSTFVGGDWFFRENCGTAAPFRALTVRLSRAVGAVTENNTFLRFVVKINDSTVLIWCHQRRGIATRINPWRIAGRDAYARRNGQFLIET